MATESVAKDLQERVARLAEKAALVDTREGYGAQQSWIDFSEPRRRDDLEQAS